jgi:hypothetical protein
LTALRRQHYGAGHSGADEDHGRAIKGLEPFLKMTAEAQVASEQLRGAVHALSDVMDRALSRLEAAVDGLAARLAHEQQENCALSAAINDAMDRVAAAALDIRATLSADGGPAGSPHLDEVNAVYAQPQSAE